MTREEAVRCLSVYSSTNGSGQCTDEQHYEAKQMAIKAIEQTRWIPVSERPPKDLEPVNITWVNHNPESYYTDIKDKQFTATGHYCNGRWWWYSVTCQDYLEKYGRCDVDAMDDDIEVIAWMPLPAPFEPQEKKNDKWRNARHILSEISRIKNRRL